MSETTPNPPGSEILLYQTEDHRTRIEVRLDGETVWLSQKQMSELFQTTVPNINTHIHNIFEEGELQQEATIKDYLIVQQEGTRQVSRPVTHYSLDVIISVGYRVRSHRGTQFRIWATQRLREYIVKGFTLDDERLKNPPGAKAVGPLSRVPDYFDELLERIRAIRASERRFYLKITDIYATSIDYDEHTQITRDFFATVQNKFHYAITGHTAAELIAKRADATQPNMGLTSWRAGPRGPIRRTDVEIAKNYLNEDELRALNLIVDQYLSFAEFQAQQRRPMYMADWVSKLHDFLKLNERQILSDAGTISHELAMEKAHGEFDKFDAESRALEAQESTSDFDQAIRQITDRPHSRRSRKGRNTDSDAAGQQGDA